MSQSIDLAWRDAVADDITAIVALVESAYRGDASRAGWTTEADMLEGQRIDARGLVELIADPQARILLAAHQGRLVACCELRHLYDVAYFGMFAVCPDRQAAGIGKQVLAEAERIARDEWQCDVMQMTVIDIRDELIAWYERRGYRRTGIHKPFPYGDERYGIPQRDDLRFEILQKSLR